MYRSSWVGNNPEENEKRMREWKRNYGEAQNRPAGWERRWRCRLSFRSTKIRVVRVKAPSLFPGFLFFSWKLCANWQQEKLVSLNRKLNLQNIWEKLTFLCPHTIIFLWHCDFVCFSNISVSFSRLPLNVLTFFFFFWTLRRSSTFVPCYS